jgi:hypothetical protein
MIAIAGEIANPHLGIGNSHLDEALDLACIHRHRATPPRSASRNMKRLPERVNAPAFQSS